MNNEEHRIQAAAIKAVSHYSWSRWLFAIPNGGARNAITGARLKAEGVKPGVWDLELPMPSQYKSNGRTFHGLRIEVKTPSGRLTKEQAEFGIFSAQHGWAIAICRSTGEIVDACKSYMGEPWTWNDVNVEECNRRIYGRRKL